MSLQFKLIFLCIVFSLLPLSIAGVLSFEKAKQELMKETTEKLSAVADVQKKRLNEALGHYLEEAQTIASLTGMKQELETHNTKQTKESAKRIHDIIVDARRASHGIKKIEVYDNRFILIASTDEKENGTAHHAINPHNIAGNSFELNEIYKDESNALRVRIFGPIFSNNKKIGVIEVIASADQLVAITEDSTGLGKTGEVTLVKKNSAGDALFLTPLRFDAGAALRRAIPKENKNVPAVAVLQGEEGVMSGGDTLDYRGVPVLAALRYIKPLKWGLVVKVDREEIFKPVSDLAVFTALTLAAFFIFASFFSIIMIRKFLKPIGNLYLASERLRKGDFSSRADIASGDEVGRLAIAFNNMAARLEQLYQGLEEKVHERTEDLHKFQLAVENAFDHIAITDLEGRILYANKSTERVTGFSQEEVVGNKASSLHLWGGQMSETGYKKLWNTIREKKEAFHMEITNKKKNGELYESNLAIIPLKDDLGDVRYYVQIQRDITQEKAIDRAKTEFVSLVSHQLRTPLSAIKWYTEMLLDGDAGRLKKEQKELLDLMYESDLRMVDLVEALLDVSRLNLGTFVMDIAKTDPAALVESVSEEMRPDWKKKKIKFSSECDKSIVSINADPRLLRMIFQNLLSNAFKYTPEGGIVNFSFRKIEKGESFGGRTSQKERIGISVSDTGCGIPEKDRESIFTRFYRGSNANTMDTNGFGLGLSIVKSVIGLSGGEIWFDSEEMKGTTFYVEFPLFGMKQKKQVSRVAPEITV
jgi:PAS domain S-box-containing protein